MSDEQCPYHSRIHGAARALRGFAGAPLPGLLRQLLDGLGLGELVTATVVLRGTRCDCVAVISDGPAEALAASRELKSAAIHALNSTPAADDGSGVSYRGEKSS